MCNVVRQRLDVHKNDDFVRKRSGLGGTGGYKLSPELRAKFGTFGFTRPQQAYGFVKPNLSSTLDDRVTSIDSSMIKEARTTNNYT